MSDRRFGVEIEHGNANGYNSVARSLKSAGFKSFDVGSDGSGVEARTPPLQGEEGYKTLMDVMAHLTNIGGYVTKRDGMHVHFEAIDYIEAEDAKMAQLVSSWLNVVGIMDKLVAPNRRKHASTPKDLTKADVETIKNFDHSKESLIETEKKRQKIVSDFHAGRITYGTYYTRYNELPGKGSGYGLPNKGRGALNLTNVWEAKKQLMTGNLKSADKHYQPTIENRLHEGTLDGAEAVAWIKFFSRFLDYCLETHDVIPRTTHPSTLFRRLELDEDVQEQLLSKAKTSDSKVMPEPERSYY